MPCSAVTLSLATITGIIATALLVIAFATDNWLYTEVKRAQIEQYTKKHPENTNLVEQLDKYYYYTRTQGLFRICFPKKPPKVQTYLSPVETHCMNIDYSQPDDKVSDDNNTRLKMGWFMIALFIIAFFSIFMAFWTGVIGCWKRSPGSITSTAILMLVACLLSAGAMALWHGVEYYEKEKQVGEEYYQKWSEALKQNTIIWYDWSFYLAWTGVGFCFGTMILFLIAASCLRRENSRDRTQNIQYIMPVISYDWSYVVAWVGVGWSLVSAILFSASAICLRGERMREEAMNMQYLMPVYPQKQQAYAYATGYPAPTAYPAPYYHGSQAYGPYNY